MSSSFDKTPSRKSSPFASRWTHRRSAWASSASVVGHPEQLSGPRARTRIRPGVTTPRSTVMDAISVGIDVSKRELVIAVHPTGEQWTTATTPAAIGTVVTRLRALAPQIIVVEATGGYERAVVAAMAVAELPVAVVNPRQVRAFAQAIGRTAKTDVVDAKILAAFGARLEPAPRPVADTATQELADFLARRRQLLEMIGMERGRLEHAAPTGPLTRELRRHIRWLERRVDDVDDEIGTCIAAHPTWRVQEELLRSVP